MAERFVDELGLSKSKPVSATADGAAPCQDDDEEKKRLYQRIVEKTLNYLAHDRLDLKYVISCLASAVSSPALET